MNYEVLWHLNTCEWEENLRYKTYQLLACSI